jgi:hypothetical protein
MVMTEEMEVAAVANEEPVAPEILAARAKALSSEAGQDEARVLNPQDNRWYGPHSEPAQPKPEPSDVSGFIAEMKMAYEDPMWADHCELPKRVVKAWHDALERLAKERDFAEEEVTRVKRERALYANKANNLEAALAKAQAERGEADERYAMRLDDLIAAYKRITELKTALGDENDLLGSTVLGAGIGSSGATHNLDTGPDMDVAGLQVVKAQAAVPVAKDVDRIYQQSKDGCEDAYLRNEMTMEDWIRYAIECALTASPPTPSDGLLAKLKDIAWGGPGLGNYAKRIHMLRALLAEQEKAK